WIDRYGIDVIHISNGARHIQALVSAGLIGMMCRENSRHDIDRQNAIRGLGWERLYNHPTGMIGDVGAIHEIDRALSVVDARIFIAAGELESEARSWFVSRFDFGAVDRGIEIVVDGRAVNNAGYLISRVVIMERIGVEGHRAVQQRI